MKTGCACVCVNVQKIRVVVTKGEGREEKLEISFAKPVVSE